MAHTCPDCGQTCYCNSDWDDCCNDFEEDVINCTHYLTPECQGNDDYPDDDDPFEEHPFIIRFSKEE